MAINSWETRLLVVYVASVRRSEARAAIYAGLTRLKRHPAGSHIIVVCSEPELSEFGERTARWPTEAGARRMNDRRVVSGIIHMLNCGGRWADSPGRVWSIDDGLQSLEPLEPSRHLDAHPDGTKAD